MNLRKPFGQVISINEARYALRVEDIFPLIDTQKLKLPLGDCTDVIKNVGQQAIDKTYGGKVYFQTLNNIKGFEQNFSELLADQNNWKVQVKPEQQIKLHADNDTRIGVVQSAPAPFPN